MCESPVFPSTDARRSFRAVWAVRSLFLSPAKQARYRLRKQHRELTQAAAPVRPRGELHGWQKTYHYAIHWQDESFGPGFPVLQFRLGGRGQPLPVRRK